MRCGTFELLTSYEHLSHPCLWIYRLLIYKGSTLFSFFFLPLSLNSNSCQTVTKPNVAEITCILPERGCHSDSINPNWLSPFNVFGLLYRNVKMFYDAAVIRVCEHFRTIQTPCSSLTVWSASISLKHYCGCLYILFCVYAHTLEPVCVFVFVRVPLCAFLCVCVPCVITIAALPKY